MAEKAERRESPIARRDPFGDLADWRPLFGRDLWSPFFGREGRNLLEDLWGRTGAGGRVAPSVDINEDENEYIVTAELPGVRPEDVTVELEDDVLTIRGEKRSEREEKKERRRLVERSYGTFTRSFSLPANADPERVSASFKDGVLTVRIGKRPETKPRTVDIES
jgi:HSP20 family protein